ncbi:MAG: O-antigen ligase family protein [Anaerolinea sp.]|nr:O-antigen ligase family protein [Anaerolinea sp.]
MKFLFKRIEPLLDWLQNLAIYGVLFLAGWWWRPEGLIRQPYYLGFVVTLPVIATLVIWSLRGFPGLGEALQDQRRFFLLGLALFTLWALCSVVWSRFRDPSLTAAGQFVLVCLFTLTVTCLNTSRQGLIRALGAGLIWQASIVIVQFLRGQPVGLQIIGEFEIRPGGAGLSVVMAEAERLMRPYGLTIHPNVIGGYLAVGLLALSGWLVKDQIRRWQGAVRFVTLAVGLWAICFTFSRSAWGALIGGLGVVIAASFRRGAARINVQRATAAALMGAAVFAGFVIAYGDFVLARTTLSEGETELRSVVEREVFYEIATWMIRDQPIRGVGMGAFAWESWKYLVRTPHPSLRPQNVHNIPLLVTAELGFVGLSLWLFTLISGFWSAWRTTSDPIRVGLMAGSLALFAVGLLDFYPHAIFHFALLSWGCLGLSLQGTPEHQIAPMEQPRL